MPVMKRVLFVSNPHVGSVSARVKQVIVKALEADFKLEVAETAARNHAGDLARDAVDRDFDAVIAFGGDGTINEASQGLVGTEVGLAILPGGSTNVISAGIGHSARSGRGDCVRRVAPEIVHKHSDQRGEAE